MSAGRGEAPRAAWSLLGLSFRGWALGAVGLHLLLGILLFEPILHPGGDNAIYMILGEALREGAGYRDLYLPDTPIHTKYPPLYPAGLAVLGWLGGLQLFKLASLACTAGAVWLTARLGRRLIGAAPALLAAGLVALHPVLLDYGHWVLSEAPFVLLALLSLWWLERAEEEGARAFGLGVAAAVAAFLTRTAGLPLLAAAVALPLLARRWGRAAAAASAAAAAMAGWAAVQGAAPPGQAGYLEELLLRDPYDPAAGAVGPAELLARAAGNAWAYLSEVLPAALAGMPPHELGGATVALGFGVAALALGGWIVRALHRLGAPELFTALYAGLIVLWPEAWTDARFLLPLAPLLLLYAMGGAAAAGRRWAGRGTAVAIAAALLIALPAVWSAATLAPERARCLAAYRSGTPCDPPAFGSLYAAARWAGEHTPADAVIANRKPSLFYWVGRRRGDVYPFSTDPDVVVTGLEAMGADFVVVDQVSGTTFRYLLPAIRAHRSRFDVAYEGGDPVTLVLRFLPPPRTAHAVTKEGAAGR